MADIIKCAGGEVLSTLPLSVEEGVLIVACEEDIGSCRAAMEAGVLVHSTELILGGVLHQELDLHSYPTLSSSSFTFAPLSFSTSLYPQSTPLPLLYIVLSLFPLLLCSFPFHLSLSFSLSSLCSPPFLVMFLAEFFF